MSLKIYSHITFLLGVSLSCLLAVSSCKKDSENKATPYHFSIPNRFPTRLNIPADNPLTYEGIELGRYLFYDGRLSGRTHPDSLMSCATCHQQQNAFECGINHPKFTDGHPQGLTGIKTQHGMLPLINLVWNDAGYTWNGFVSNQNPAAHNLEDIVWMTVFATDEIAGDTTRTKQVIQSIAGYPQLFERAFGSPEITFKRISQAIAQFVRTLVSANSKFDRYMNGSAQLSEQELQGFELFMTEEGADCFHCHGGDGNLLFTTNLFYNNGKDTLFLGESDHYSITGNRPDMGAYKAPTLRNIEFTAPYMHDGQFKTLENVIEFYSSGVKNTPYTHSFMHHSNKGGIKLTPAEKNALLAFLKTLSDSEFISNPNFSKPTQFPDGSTQ